MESTSETMSSSASMIIDAEQPMRFVGKHDVSNGQSNHYTRSETYGSCNPAQAASHHAQLLYTRREEHHRVRYYLQTPRLSAFETCGIIHPYELVVWNSYGR